MIFYEGYKQKGVIHMNIYLGSNSSTMIIIICCVALEGLYPLKCKFIIVDAQNYGK